MRGPTSGVGRQTGALFPKVFVVLGLAVALVANAGPAAAWQLVGNEHGLVGVYGMVDNTDHPQNAGALCHYVGSPVDHFRSMTIRHPVAWARDVTGHENHQVLGWVAKLQRATSASGPWTTVHGLSRREGDGL